MKKRYIAIFISIIVIIFVGIFLRLETESFVHSNKVNETNEVNTVYLKAISITSWSPQDIKDFECNNVIHTAKYGRIVESNVPTNDYGIAKQYNYLPNTPFPSNSVKDDVTLVITTINNKKITNNFQYILTPKFRRIEVVLLQK